AAGAARCFVTGRRAGATARDVTDGRVIWTTDEPSSVPPVAAGTRVAFVGTNDVRGHEQATGRLIWRAEFDGPPTLAFGAVDRIGVVVDGSVRAWDAAGGSPVRAVV